MRKKWWAIPTLVDSGKCEFWPERHRGKWRAYFGRSGPLHLDIGCGSGDFSLARANREHNRLFVLWDREPGILVYTLENLLACKQETIDRIAIVARDVDCLGSVFSAGEVDSITIHFPNPWPKSRQKKRRLTHPSKLRLYQSILAPGGTIDFRTDDEKLYRETMEYLVAFGARILFASDNAPPTDPVSHYESRFRAQGVRIYRISFSLSPKSPTGEKIPTHA